MKNDTSLNDLNIVYHSQIKFDNFTLPLKIDIANITELDYILAFSITNSYKLNPVDAQPKNINELDNIKTVYFEEDNMTLSYERLEYQYEIDVIEEDRKINYCTKFINCDDLLFDNGNKNLLQYLQVDTIKDWLFENGFDDMFYSELYRIVSHWVDMITTEFTANVKKALLLDNKDGIEMNYSLAKLRTCYESMHMYYFDENKDVNSFEKLSYREQHLMQSFATKMNYIDIAINKDAKKQIEDKRNDNQPNSKRKRFGNTGKSF